MSSIWRTSQLAVLLFLLSFLATIPLSAKPKPQPKEAVQELRLDPLSSPKVGVPTQIILLMTALTLLPAIVMSLTPFLRIVVVLHFLRQALGTQTVPSNQVLIGLSLFLTCLLIQPMATDIYQSAWIPLEKGQLEVSDAFDKAAEPVKAYISKYVREKDVELFLRASGRPNPKSKQDLSLAVLAPAYVLSELKTSFQIGAVLFIPFLIVDVVVASLTVSIGMVQLPPVMISAPFKILLFVLVDGWNLVIGSLLASFRT